MTVLADHQRPVFLVDREHGHRARMLHDVALNRLIVGHDDNVGAHAEQLPDPEADDSTGRTRRRR